MKTETQHSRELILCQDKKDLADKAAKSFAKIVSDVLSKNEKCTVALSGGSTPKALYERLVKEDLAGKIEWSKIAFYVSDERCVPHESNESNYGNAYRDLLQPLKILPAMLHPTQGQDRDSDASAAAYENDIRKNVPLAKNGVPRFDIIFLGMGPDGHTASLFPGTKAISEVNKLVVKNYVDKVNADRITFTFTLINNAANVIFLVAGEDKAPVLAEIMGNSEEYPSEHVKPVDGRAMWFVDRAAAKNLDHFS